jgi:hypothetical protein
MLNLLNTVAKSVIDRAKIRQLERSSHLNAANISCPPGSIPEVDEACIAT